MGKPPAFGVVVVVEVVVVVLLGTNGVGVRKRNGVGVGTWAMICGAANVSGPAASATAA